ncbi:hypothetical protein ILP92_10565 [Maribius pontilimi]|uniref:Secreted protein n=1 Tax=Palleronia pontilimi TaxID=1964209 RepID=A0A934MA30_9RHOB|nr:hypothetical protein [Palleronia pontilimi]MBJ3763187.1 hypothetical protein [Palleronia pontilimi]
MRILTTIVLVAQAIGFAASAQEILVRTGEHATFTRIVADLPPGATWNLERDGKSLTLSTQQAASFDTRAVYQRIARTRVQRISGSEPGTLTVELACDCRVESLQQPNGWVVLDVIDDGSVVDATAGSQRNGFGPRLSMLDELRDTPIRLPRPDGPLPGPLSQALDQSDAAIDRRAAVDSARAQISEQFARGSAQGLVRARSLPTLSDPPPVQTEADDPVLDELQAGIPYPNMRVETQLDRDRPSSGATAPPKGVCLPGEMSDFATWGDEAAPFERIRTTLPQIYDENDRPDAEAHAALARAYLFATFTQEARAVLKNAPSDTPDRAFLLAIADSLDPASATTGLAKQIDCDSNAAVLAFLAEDGPLMADPDIVLRRLSNLPDPMRSYLEPRIAERFLDFNMREQAELIRNGYSRRESAPSAEASFVDAKLSDPQDGDIALALEPVVEERMPRAAEALQFVLSSRMARGEVPPDQMIEQALALSFETSDPERASLERTILQAFVRAGQFGRAIDELDRLRGRSRGPHDDIEREIFRAIADIPEDADFLRVMVPLADREITDDATRLAIVRRLMSQSLNSQAEQIIDASRAIPNREERLVRAAIAAEAGKPDIARSYLAGLEGDDVAEVLDRLEAAPPPPVAGAPVEPESLSPSRIPGIDRASTTLSRSAELRQELDALLDP